MIEVIELILSDFYCCGEYIYLSDVAHVFFVCRALLQGASLQRGVLAR
jgi:hypothetical protein